MAPLPMQQPTGDAFVTATAVDHQPEPDLRVNAIQEAREPPWWAGSGIEIARATRSWIQYGTVAFAVVCIVIGAVEGLFGR